MIVKESLISDLEVAFELSDCWAFIAISKDQCSHCNDGVPTLISHMQNRGYSVLIARVHDQSFMDCKKDELQIRSEFPDLQFVYLSSKELKLRGSSRADSVDILFDSTPVLIYHGLEQIELINSNRLVDNYGHFNLFEFPNEKCKLLKKRR